MRTVRLGAALCVLIATIGTLVAQEDGTPIPQSAWTLTFVDSQETTAANNAALNAFDGSPTTFWATRWSRGTTLRTRTKSRLISGSVYNVSAFRHLPRQDGFPHGRIAQYEFYVSLDGVNWGTPVAVGTLANVATEQEVAFAPKTGQYIRLRALSEVEGRPYTSLAELNVLTSGNLPPNGVIQAPAGNMTIAPGGTVDFNGTGSDPENNLPLTYEWNFGNGSTSTLADPPAGPVCQPGHLHRDLYRQGCTRQRRPGPRDAHSHRAVRCAFLRRDFAVGLDPAICGQSGDAGCEQRRPEGV